MRFTQSTYKLNSTGDILVQAAGLCNAQKYK